MIVFPVEYVATKWPGYLWNVNEQHLYSIKVDGQLRKMKLYRPNQWNKKSDHCYQLSHRGRKLNIEQTVFYGLNKKVSGQLELFPWKA